MRKLFDAHGGTVSVFHDLNDGRVAFQQIQDVEPVIEDNKKLQTLNDGYSPSKDLRRVASVPKVVLLRWLREAGIPVRDFQKNHKRYAKWLRRKIYDRDNEMFLTAPHYRTRRSNGVQAKAVSGLDSALAEGRKLGMS